MAIVTTNNEYYEAIAGKVREIKGTQETMFPSEMPDKVQEVYEAGTKHAFKLLDSVANFFESGRNSDLLEIFNELELPNVKYLPYLFIRNTALTGSYSLRNFNNVLACNGVFQSCSNLTVINVESATFISTASALSDFFNGCTSLTEIVGTLSFSPSLSYVSRMFDGCTSLHTIRFAENTIPITINFGSCSSLSKDSLESIVLGLSSTATNQTLTLSSTAVNDRFEGGRAGTEWQTLIEKRGNWTFTYV